VPSDTVIPFTILATVMLAALVLALWVAIREFRTPNPVEPVNGVNPPPTVDVAESTVGITSESAKKSPAQADPVPEGDQRPVELDGQ
jgi:hypothetical protein